MPNEKTLQRYITASAIVCVMLAVQGCMEPANDLTEGSGNSGSQTGAITSDEAITVKDGKVFFGERKITEEDEKQIYRSLSQKKNLADAVKKERVRGKLMQEYNLLVKSMMARHKLSQSDIDAILKKGKDEGWK